MSLSLFKNLVAKKKQAKESPWITKGILVSINRCDQLHKSFLKEKDPFFKSLLYDSFKKYRNKIVTLCRQSKSNFFNKYFRDNIKNAGKVWEGVC